MRKHECGSFFQKRGILNSTCVFELIFSLLLVSIGFSDSAFATPQVIRVDGSIFDSSGVPTTGNKDIQIKAYDAVSGGSLLWTSSAYNTVVTTGKFTINLDAAAGSPSLVDRFGERTASQAIYFQIEVDSGAANGSIVRRGLNTDLFLRFNGDHRTTFAGLNADHP